MAPVRPIGSAPVTSFIDILARNLVKIETDIDVLRWRRGELFSEGRLHGYDRETIRKRAEELK